MELYAGNTEDVGAVQTVFRTSCRDLRETSDLTVEDAGMHHANMEKNFDTWIHEALQQENVQTETPTVVQAPVDHVGNAVKNPGTVGHTAAENASNDASYTDEICRSAPWHS